MTHLIADYALQYSPIIQDLHADPNVLVTIRNGPLSPEGPGEYGGQSDVSYDVTTGTSTVDITIDPTLAQTPLQNAGITLVELAVGVLMQIDPQGTAQVAQEATVTGEKHPLAPEQNKIAAEVSKDIAKGTKPSTTRGTKKEKQRSSGYSWSGAHGGTNQAIYRYGHETPVQKTTVYVDGNYLGP